jgi:tetratricopeptide (TPR) repeat protein
MNRISIFFTIPIILISMILQGQTYSSDFEEFVFEGYKKDTINYNFIDGLFAIDSTMNKASAQQRTLELLSVIKSFPGKETKAKKEKKRVKHIYNVIHDKFFNKYNLDAYFNDIFIDGTYNCVTASALYAFAFNELQIPYHIKETPSHVFLIAYPETHKIYLETTVPGAYGYSIPKEAEVEKIVNELIAYKLVTKSEVSEKGYMKFYEDYFYGKEFIDKRALIGMQYYNKGLTNLNELNYTDALNNLRKAKVFYSSPLIKPILKSIMFIQVNELEFNTQNDIDYLIELLSISKYPEDYSISSLKSSLFKVIEQDGNDAEFIEEAISKLREIDDEKVKNEAVEFLLEYLARNAATDEDHENALRYADSILEVNSNSKIAEQIIEYVCFKKVLLSMYDLKSLNSFLEMTEKYEFLKDNNRYFISLAHFYGNIAFMNFKNKDVKTASSYLKKFEYIMDNNSLLNDINKNMVVELYLKAGNYYYYKEKYQSSYKIFSKGLLYVPDHPDLVKKAQWSEEEL